MKNSSWAYKLVHQENQGQGSSRNLGLKHAKGDWIFFLDSDDVIQPDAIETMVNCTFQNKVDIVFCNYQYVKLGDEFAPPPFNNGFRMLEREELQVSFLLRKIVILAPGTLYNSFFLKKNNLSFPKLRFCEDILFVWEVLRVVNKAIYLQIPLYNYLIRKGSIMHATPLRAMVKTYQEFEKFNNLYVIDNQIPSLVKKFFLSRWVFGALRTGIKYLSKSEFFDLYSNLGAQKHCRNLLKFPDAKIKIMSFLFWRKNYIICKIINVLMDNIKIYSEKNRTN